MGTQLELIQTKGKEEAKQNTRHTGQETSKIKEEVTTQRNRLRYNELDSFSIAEVLHQVRCALVKFSSSLAWSGTVIICSSSACICEG